MLLCVCFLWHGIANEVQNNQDLTVTITMEKYQIFQITTLKFFAPKNDFYSEKLSVAFKINFNRID